MINTGEVASFIDNIIVEIKEEKRYNKIVEEIVRRLEEIDLLERCKWKVREIGFLRVVIGPDGIKMEKEKMKAVLDWLVLRMFRSF